MRESSYIYSCDWNVQGERCNITSTPMTDYYAVPVGWGTITAKVEKADDRSTGRDAGPFHFCPHHMDIMFDEIISDHCQGHPNFENAEKYRAQVR